MWTPTAAQIDWGELSKFLTGGGVTAVLTAAGWLVLRYYRGSAEKIVRVREAETKASRAEGEEDREDRTTSLAEYGLAVKEWQRISRVYERKIAKLEARAEQQDERQRQTDERERRCQRKLLLVVDRLQSHEDALKAKGIPFRPLSLDGEVELFGPDEGAAP